jgi:hypothetical protein
MLPSFHHRSMISLPVSERWNGRIPSEISNRSFLPVGVLFQGENPSRRCFAKVNDLPVPVRMIGSAGGRWASPWWRYKNGAVGQKGYLGAMTWIVYA